MTALDRTSFVLRMARALHRYGHPAHRLEESLVATSERLGLEAQFFSTPTSVFASFGQIDRQHTHLLRLDPGGTDLGRLAKVLPMLVDTGVDYIETFEPNEGDISLGDAKKRFGDRTCLMGNFDCLVLAFGSVDDARKEARRCLQEGMEGGGYVMATADEVPVDAKFENLQAMVEVVQEQGRY